LNVALRPLRVLSLFSGGGGLDLGIELAVPGSRAVVYVEREAYAAAALVARMEEKALVPAPVWDDVTTFDGRAWRGVVDCVAGGFPCQDISNAGKREGIEGERSGLWTHFARIIGEVGPQLVFVENVGALVVRGLDVVLGDLAALGFDAEWGVWERTMPELPTSAIASSSWPTPVATPYGSSQNGICKDKPSGCTLSLERQAKAMQWATPNAADSDGGPHDPQTSSRR
jgi:hypothetical protein